MNKLTTPLLLSLKPCHAEMVFVGLKKAELRRKIAMYAENRFVFVYVTSPIRELRGGFRVGQVWKGSPGYIWELVSSFANINKREFDTYFSGCNIAFALEITSVWEYENPVSLEALRGQCARFVVPQSWRYLRPDEHDFLAGVPRSAIRAGKSFDDECINPAIGSM